MVFCWMCLKKSLSVCSRELIIFAFIGFGLFDSICLKVEIFIKTQRCFYHIKEGVFIT